MYVGGACCSLCPPHTPSLMFPPSSALHHLHPTQTTNSHHKTGDRPPAPILPPLRHAKPARRSLRGPQAPVPRLPQPFSGAGCRPHPHLRDGADLARAGGWGSRLGVVRCHMRVDVTFFCNHPVVTYTSSTMGWTPVSFANLLGGDGPVPLQAAGEGDGGAAGTAHALRGLCRAGG